jgi:hypothetical protein
VVTEQAIRLHINKVYRSKSGNDCCHSMQKLLSSSFLSQNIKIKIYRIIILPVVVVVVVLCVCVRACACVHVCARETWSLAMRNGTGKDIRD